MTFGCLLGSLWVPLGCPLDPFGYPLDHFGYPFGPLWDHFGGPCPPLGTILDDFGIILGPSDCRKGPKSYEERCWDVVFVNPLIYYVSLDEKRTLTGAVTTCLPLKQLS